MIDHVEAIKNAVTAKVMASGALDAIANNMIAVAEAHLHTYLYGCQITIGQHIYTAAHSACLFSDYDCERGKDPVELRILLHKKDADKLEKKRAYTASKYFQERRWYMVYDNTKEVAFKYRSFHVSVRDAVTGNYRLELG